MNNSIDHRDDLTRIDLISFDLRSEGREVAFTSCFENEEKPYEINSFESNISKFSYDKSKCYTYLRAYKSVDKLKASVGEVLTYKVMIDNLSSRPIYNTILQDNLPAGTTYIINSLKLNGYIQSGAYPQLGFFIQRINPDSRIIVTFEVSINSAKPVPKNISGFATIIINEEEAINTNIVNTEIKFECSKEDKYFENDYYEKEKNNEKDYYNNEKYYENNYYEEENYCQSDYYGQENYCQDDYYQEVISNFRKNNITYDKGLDLSSYCAGILVKEKEKEESYLNLRIVKIADKDCVELNDIITYRINIRNDERANLFNIQLIDWRDNTLEFIKGTLIFNGKKINVDILEELINIGDLQLGEECIIEYKMKVKSTTKDGYIKSSIYAKCVYSINQKDLIEGKTKVEEVKIKVKAISFKTYNFNRLVELDEKNAEDISIEEVDIDVTIADKYVLKGYKLKDNEGNILSGYQLKFFGHIDVLVQYSILNSDVEVRLKAWSIPFSSYLILPPDYEEGDNIEIHYELYNSTIDILNFEVVNIGANILFYI